MPIKLGTEADFVGPFLACMDRSGREKEPLDFLIFLLLLRFLVAIFKVEAFNR